MVNDHGQLYTIEGVSAAILIIFTAYLVLSATNLYTQGDTHISDMQLEQLGNDVLRIMDTPRSDTQPSELEEYIQNLSLNESFHDSFILYSSKTTDGRVDNLKIRANIINDSGPSPLYIGDEYYRENSVKVTRWVRDPDTNRTVLLEVLIWRS